MSERAESPPRPSLAAVLEAQSAAQPELAIIATSLDGTVTFWNRMAGTLYGWRPKDAVGRNILDLTPAVQSRAEAADVMQALREGGAWHGEMVVRTHAGQPFRAFVADFLVETATAPVIVGLSVRSEERGLLEGLRRQIEDEVRAALRGG